MNGYLIIILAYSLLLIGIGFLLKRYVKGTADFFVAGRNLGPLLLFTTLIAPNIGAGSTVGNAGLGFQYGWSAAWWIAASAVGTFLLAFFIGPKIWQIAKTHSLYTLGDYLEYRYHRNFRGLISLLMAVGTLAIFSGQLMGIAWLLTAVAGTDKLTGVMIGAVVVVLYFGVGGLLSAAYVNIIEIIVKFFGFLIAIPFALSYVGGFSGLELKVAEHLQDAVKTENYFSPIGMGSTMILGYFLMLTPSFFISPGLIGKVYGGRNEKAVRWGTAMCGLVMLLFSVVPTLLGMCAYAAFPDLVQRELSMPTIMRECMPFWASALALAAIFSAEVSAADAVLYMIATSFTKDLYKTFINPQIGDQDLLRLSRVATVGAGIIGVGLAILLPNIITALSIFYSLMSVSLTAPLLFGLYTKKASTKSAFWAAGLGIVTTVILQFGFNGKGIGILNAQSTGILLTLVLMAIGLWLSPAKERDAIRV